jgi:hypothetical protein
MLVKPLVVDGHCPECGRHATFHRAKDVINPPALRNVLQKCDTLRLDLVCTRDTNHKVVFIIRFKEDKAQKIGQYPSLADIANDESKAYKSVLDKQDSREFHKAIGLAAHGVGIGSFVYFRRIFERLIIRRFEEFKAVEAWTDEEFYSKRMSEKIEFLRSHLPPFLVENHNIYSILSLAVHELSEEQSLRFLPVIKASIIVMLDEDKKKKEELKLRNSLKAAIAGFAPEPHLSTARK